MDDTTPDGHKRKSSLDELGIEANQVGPRGKPESEAIREKRKKILPSHRYRDLFKSRKEAKSADSAKGKRQGPCTSGDSGGSTKKIPVAEDDDLHKEEGVCAEDCAESTSRANQGGLDFDLKEVASGTPELLNTVESHPGQKPLSSSVEVCSDSETRAHMDISRNADVNTEEKDSQLDSQMGYQENKCIICSSDVEGHQVASNSSTSLLREKLSPFIVSGPKSVSSRLVEYWVPVQMSNVQLEQYCSSLLTNLTALCSKNDPVGLLREILISARKSCDHPYAAESEILLAIGVPSSGKLYLLDAILPKMKDQGQRVIILFKDFLGDILEDFVRLKFGEDSYERVDGGGVPSRTHASVTKFNEEKGRFIFLIETRACSPSIKVSSVDAVVIFGSDWNPLNDLKALQKIKMDSELEINVFRLYTMCTIEEKVLLLSTRSVLFESKLQGIKFSTSHMLLAWGASYLFRKLDELHDCDGCLEIWPLNSDMKDVLQEFMSLLQKHDTCTSMKFISSAWQNGASYSKDISLLGEQYTHLKDLKDEESARVFWEKLLEGRQPRWRFLPLSSRRNRKRVKYYDGSSETSVQPDEAIKRQKKMGNTNGESRSPRVSKDVGKEPGLFRTSPRNRPQLSPEAGGKTASAPKSQTAISSELRDQQKSLHQVLKPDMAKLFLTLGLKEDIQQMAERFLVYMMTNQRVIREPDTALQAFQISVCWIAAFILSEKLDHVESLSLAREHLNFNCGNDEAEYAFSKMRFPMTMFMRSEGVNRQAFLKNLVMGTGGLASEAMNGNASESAVSMQIKEKVAEGLLVQEGLDERALPPMQTIEQTDERLKYGAKIKENCNKKVASHIEDMRYEVEELEKSFQEKRAKREKKYKHEYDIICKINNSEADKSEKLKNLEAKHRQKLDQLDSDMATALKGIEASYQAKQDEAVKEADCMMERFDSWIKSGLSDSMWSKEAFEERGVEVVPVNSSSLSENDLKEGNANVPDSADVQVPLPQTPEPHNDAENSGSAEVPAVSADRERVIADNDATSKSPPTATQINHEATTSANIAEGTIPDSLGVQGIHVLSAVTTDEAEQIATSKNDQLSAENPALQTEVDASADGIAASEGCTPSRMEQLHDASSSTDTESTDSPSTIKPSVVQPFTNQHKIDSPPAAQEHATSCNRLNQLTNQHVCIEASGIQNTIIQDLMPSADNFVGVTNSASDQAGCSLPPEQAVPLDTTASHPMDLTQPRLASCGVPENQFLVSSLPCQTAEARIQVDQRPLNRSVEVTPRPSLDVSFNPALQNSSQFENYMSSRSLPATVSASYFSPDPVVEFDPLQRELARMNGESIQVSKTHEDMVSRLKLDCDKEIEDLEAVAQIRRKYGSSIQEADASFSQKKNELEHNKSKVVMNFALAEAFRGKCMSTDHRGAQRVVPSNLTQQLLQSQFSRRSVLPATLGPQTSSSPPTQNVRAFVRTLASMSHLLNGTTLRSQPLPPPPEHSTGSHGGPYQTETSARPMSLPQTSGSARSNAAAGALPPLPEIARNFETWNLSEFETSPDAGQFDPFRTGGVATGLVCLSDDE